MKRLLRVLVPAALLLPSVLLVAAPASASTVTSAVFSSSDSKTVTVAGTVYAKKDGTVTLTVTTSSDTKCVDVAGAFSGHLTSSSGKSSWTFTSPKAGSGDGVQAVTATASPAVSGNSCIGTSGSAQASYVLDNTGPVITGALSPAPNANGWNNTPVTVSWTATDAGAGVSGSQPFRVDRDINSGGTQKQSAQQDRLGNQGQDGTVTLNIDTRAPSITATKVTTGNTTTVTFTCVDSESGKQASGIATCVADGTSPASNAKTITGSGTVTGTATDKAGNTATTSVQVVGDSTPPTLTGAPTTAPNSNGWYADDVTIHWTCADNAGGSGLAAGACPADSTLTGEGARLSATRTLADIAGNSTTATSAPPVNIDRTAPVTGLSGTSNDWVNGAVTVTLEPSDNLSGVDRTTYAVDGGAQQTGTSVTLDDEGDHTLTVASVDKAGNAEAPRTVHVRIDRTAPTIAHHFTPLAYADGQWTNADVTVTFDCDDQGGSGLATCTAPSTVDTEGAAQQVPGRATDNAGNAATDTAVVSVDKTAPVVTATPDRAPNANGWYDGDVTVGFPATDALSGVATAPAAKTLGQGAGQSASGTATDAAGNTATATASGIDVDETPPVLTASVDDGWHTGDVTVAWSCADALSGVDTPPADQVVTGEGDDLTSTATCTDKAGNTATRTVGGIRIDRTAPAATAAVPAAPATGWYRADVPVTLHAADNLSGVDSTWYAVDGGAAQRWTGSLSLTGDGTHTVTYWSQDAAGNAEAPAGPLTVRIDTTAPVTTAVNPISPATGWFVTSGVPFAFDADDAVSGVDSTFYAVDGGDTRTYGQPFTADLSTGSHQVTYWSVDVAGNVETGHTLTVKVDTQPPVITGTRTPAANAAGWNNTPVDVRFTCTDADSGVDGIAGCAGDSTLSNDGADQSVHGEAADVAGNRSATDVGPINVDRTRPTLTGVASTRPNGAGWYRGDVSVGWVGDDALSGIDPASQPAPTVVTGEGTALSAGPVTIADKAGNVSDPATVTGLRIDRTAPVVTGAPTTAPNAAGWYAGDVVVDFGCTDALSGVASCPTSLLVKGDGANQSVTGDPATDVAGNTSAGKTVGGINIDGSAPSTTIDNQCTAGNGNCRGATATVVLTATDQTGLSGVKEIHYRVGTGAEQVAAGGSKTVTVPLDGSGSASVTYWAVDNAGNVEPPSSATLKWDNISPAVTHTVSPAPNAAGWNTAPVTVTFSARDDDAGSGVASVTAPVTVSTETAGTVVTGTAKDTAGNTGTDSVTVKLDRTAPTVTGAVTKGTRGANGWYTGPVTVHFTCTDSLSGVAVCPDDVTLTANGAAQSVTRSAADKAGNTGSVTVAGISIDQDKPVLTTADVNVQNGIYQLGAVPAPACTARDAVSGVASCVVTVGTATVGTIGWTATATDKAGNVSTATGSYRVVYRFDGFLQPINDTARQPGVISTFKAATTVPVRFQLKKSNGTVVQATAAPVWVAPVKGTATCAVVNETVSTATPDTGTGYRWDGTQYAYNWKAGGPGNLWRLGVTLNDGQTYTVTIGLH